MNAEKTWLVEVAYATPARQEVIAVSVRPGATIEQVIRESEMLLRFPEIDLSRHRVGIFGEIARLHDPVHDHDRVEIYRPLMTDPKEGRRNKAARGRKKAGRR